MSSRDDILKAVQVSQMRWLEETPLPNPPRFDRDAAQDLPALFADAMTAVGGSVIELETAQTLLNDATSVASFVPAVAAGDVNLEEIADPNELAGLSYFVTRGELGVAENGAIWISEKNLAHRAAPFIAQHVVVVLDPETIVSDMHDAYRKIEVRGAGYGVFVSGPSKTADIEQSLVLGAHGPRSLQVVLTSSQ